MFLIEPCCAPKHVSELVKRVGEGGTVLWHGYGDLSLSELLPAVLRRYAETEVTLVMPWLPDALAEIIAKWMRKQWARMDGKGSINVISHMTLIADIRESRSPLASQWLKENPFGERLTLRSVQQNDTAIVLPGMAWYGPVNITYGAHFTAIVTKNASTIAGLREMYKGLR